MNTPHPDPTAALPNRRKERERLLEAVSKSLSSGRYPLIFCPPIAVAQEITKLLTENNFPVSVHNQIFHVNRVYDGFGANLGKYTMSKTRHTKNKVMIFSLPQGPDRASIKLRLPEGPVFYVEETMAASNAPEVFRDVTERFFLSACASGPELKEIITTVNPKEVYFFGPYAKKYAEEFKGVAQSVKPLFSNDQPTLL